MIEFTVVKGQCKDYPTIIGLPTLLNLNIIKRVESIMNMNEKNILQNYKDVFTGTGIITNFKYDIKLKEGAKGSIATCRKVSIALLEPLKKELEKMEKLVLLKRYMSQLIG